MKTAFLLLIIYNLQNFARSQNGSPINKSNPKKVYPLLDNVKLINTGALYKKYDNQYKEWSTPVHRPVFQRDTKQKYVHKSAQDSSYFPIDIFGDLKTRVKRIQYLNDKHSQRNKRDANASAPAVAAESSTPLTDKPKPKETKPAAEVNPNNASLSRRSASKPATAAAKSPAKETTKVEKSHKVAKHNAEQKPVLRSKGSKSHKRVRGRKHANPQHHHSLRKHKRPRRRDSKLAAQQGKSSAQEGKPPAQEGKSPAQEGKPPAHQGKADHKQRKAKPVARSKSSNQRARPAAGRRLIAARDAHPEDYPYMVSIQKDRQHWCAGAIINPLLIVTTANCFWKSSAISRMKVRAGARSIDHGGQQAYIAEVMKHPGWSIRKNPDNDIAFALLDRRLKFSDAVHGVDMPNKVMMPAFDDVWVTSYGAERRDGIFDRRRMTLQVMRAQLMPETLCANITSRFNVPLTENFICLQQIGRRAPCTRDTGAPAVSDGILWGLASWGIRKLCGTERFPAMFSYTASQANMEFIINATTILMSEERLKPFLDRVPAVRVKKDGGTLAGV